jgi:hypothetical protein
MLVLKKCIYFGTVTAIQRKYMARFYNLITYVLTPWSRVLLEKLTGFAASQEIPRIYGTRKFITIIISAHNFIILLLPQKSLLNGEGRKRGGSF